MIKVVHINIGDTKGYAIQWSWLGLFKRYRWCDRNEWEPKGSHFIKYAVHKDIKSAIQVYNELNPKIVAMTITELEKVIYGP